MDIGLIAPAGVAVPPPAGRGTGAVIDRLARGLVRAGHRVLLAAAAGSTCPVPLVGGTGPAAEGADQLADLRHVVVCRTAMARADVVHDHTVTGPLHHRPRPGQPLVATAHGPFDATSGPMYRAMRGVAVLAVSHAQAATAAGVPLAGVIHQGLDVGSVPVGRGTGGYASFVGRMSAGSGAREAALVARVAGVPLRMSADLRGAAERAFFDARVAPLLGGDVEFLGELGRAEELELVGDSFALVHPGRAEPSGLTMIEALATGTPVVATPSGAAPEVVEDGVTGLLCPNGITMAAALPDAALLDRAACRASAVCRFSTERMVGAHVRLYEDLLSGPPVARRPAVP
ncbi:MAG: glycosyltransferase [Pseudonocardiales bacterium]|nr:glycosyltransferase [Pseudonocardiales bacterium]